MQAELFPGVSTLLRAPDGSEISIRDIEVVLQQQRAVVGNSPEATSQHCLSVAEELLVIQRLQQHKDYLRNSGLSNVHATGTDGFGASLSDESGGWDLGIFQENLRRGVEQIVRSIRQSRDPYERVMNSEQASNAPSRSPSLYARQTEQVNRMVSVLQDVYFFLSPLPTSPSRSAPTSSLTSPIGFQSVDELGPTSSKVNLTSNYGQLNQTAGGLQRHMPSSQPSHYVPARSISSSQAMTSQETNPKSTEPRSTSYGYQKASETNLDDRRGKPFFSEEAVLKTQQLTDALKPRTLSRMESSSGLKWTRSLSRRKSKKKLNRAISNPHLVSTTQNLDNAIDLVSLPQSPATGTPGDSMGRSSGHSESSNNTAHAAQFSNKSHHPASLKQLRSSPQNSFMTHHPGPSHDQTVKMGLADVPVPGNNTTNPSPNVNPWQTPTISEPSTHEDRSETGGFVSQVAEPSSEVSPSPQALLQPSSPHIPDPAVSSQATSNFDIARDQLYPAITPTEDVPTVPQGPSNPAVRKSLLVNMGIQEASPKVPAKDLSTGPSPRISPKASPSIPVQENSTAFPSASSTVHQDTHSAPSNTSPALPIQTYVPGLGAIDANSPGKAPLPSQSPEASFHTTKSFTEAPQKSHRDLSSGTAHYSQAESPSISKVRESQVGEEVITFPTEEDIDEQSDAHTDIYRALTSTQSPSISTPLKRADTVASQRTTATSPTGTNVRRSYGDSVYDMYMGKTMEDDSLFKKTGIPVLRDDDPRGSRFVRTSRMYQRSMGPDSMASSRLGRSDNPVWQILAGLNDRSSMYSDQSKRFSDLSALSRRDGPVEDSEDRALDEREAESEAQRNLFKEARSAQPTLPGFADIDSIVLSDDSKTPQLSPTLPQQSSQSPMGPITETDERGIPVQIVYYNDEELPQIMDQIAQGNSSARIEFRRRSALPDAPVSVSQSHNDPSETAAPLDEAGVQADTSAGNDTKADEDSQLAKVEQSILSLLRPTFASLKGFS